MGLKPTRLLLGRCGDPQQNFSSIHLAGTNGKGSTAAMIASILRVAGYRVGLYTSPHLVRFNERIRVDGVPIPEAEIVRFVERQRMHIEELQTTFFETTTALAFWYFARRQVDVAVVETGLGGRLDSTNILKPEVAVITTVDLDHREILGADLGTIAREKGGVIKAGIPLVLAPQYGEVRRELAARARRTGAPLYVLKKNPGTRVSAQGTAFYWQGIRYRTPLLGRHQAENARLALQAVTLFDTALQRAVLEQGLEQVLWPSRLQRLTAGDPVYYDVAHNAQGVRTVLAALQELYPSPPPPAGLLALKSDKEIDLLAAELVPLDPLYVTSVPGKGLLRAATLARALQARGVACQVCTPIQRGLGKLHRRVRSGSAAGLILGSHYIAEEVFRGFNFSFENGCI